MAPEVPEVWGRWLDSGARGWHSCAGFGWCCKAACPAEKRFALASFHASGVEGSQGCWEVVCSLEGSRMMTRHEPSGQGSFETSQMVSWHEGVPLFVAGV